MSTPTIKEIRWDVMDRSYDRITSAQKKTFEELGLPLEVEVPKCIMEDELVHDETGEYNFKALEDMLSDWLSDTYGYCHYGFEIDI